MQSKAKTVKAYLESLPADRKAAISKIRSVIRKNLPKGFEEAMNWGMISYQVPLRKYPDTYNGQPLMYAAIASQKSHMAVYLTFCSDKKREKWFRDEYKKTGKKLDMGKSCVRFKKIEDLPVSLIGKVIAKESLRKFIEVYEQKKKR